jgi:hypothetical protein
MGPIIFPGNVFKNRSNVYGPNSGPQDFRLSPNGLYLPKVAGFAPATESEVGYDTTQRSFKSYDGKAIGAFGRCLYATRITTDVFDADTVGTTESVFATSYQFPANYWIANKCVLVWAGFRFVTPVSVQTTVGLTMRMQKAGPTNVSLWSVGTTTGSNQTRNYLFAMLIQGTAAPGAAVAIECEQVHGQGAWNASTPNAIDAAANVDTTAAETLQFTVTFGADPGAAQTVALRQLVINELN